jgi:hypothetical protein
VPPHRAGVAPALVEKAAEAALWRILDFALT